MKIEYIQISNILSFKHFNSIENAPRICFDSGVNIVIGQNGAGKSTALEVVNFIFRKILFLPYRFDPNLYAQRSSLQIYDRQRIVILSDPNEPHTHGFRLEPNWSSEDEQQCIRIKILLDEIDASNIRTLQEYHSQLEGTALKYSSSISTSNISIDGSLTLDININPSTKHVTFNNDPNNSALQYLRRYNFFKCLIQVYNIENESNPLIPLQETFTLISSYRNYNAFSPSVSLSTAASTQIQDIQHNDNLKSANFIETNEPSVFNLVRLRVAGRHHELVFTNKSESEVEQIANNEPFLKAINDKLQLINLEVRIKLLNRNSWDYSFQFHDINRNRQLNEINSLSAGQKAIIHLIFESYGRGDLKGGVVIIDEPEIHLHYQFQHEYLKIIEKLNETLSCQYILVTHSEALISSKTIDKVKRFALDPNNNTVIHSPVLTADQKTLVKILDNTRSTYAFFSKKVVLVEGDTDRYFFATAFALLYPQYTQEISILDIGGKGNVLNWKRFFDSFGLTTYYIGDFDNIFTLRFPSDPIVPIQEKELHRSRLKEERLRNASIVEKEELKTRFNALTQESNFLDNLNRETWKPLLDKYIQITNVNEKEVVAAVKASNYGIDVEVDNLYNHNIYLLKNGTIENYTGTRGKDLSHMIAFCETMGVWLSRPDINVSEIRTIIDRIAN